MKIVSLELKNFRNYEYYQYNFNNNLVLIVGNNGVGKTNVLEALYLLSTNRSFRTYDNISLINNNTPIDYSSISCKLVKNENIYNLKVNIEEKNKRLFIDNSLINKSSDFIGNLNAVCFIPSQLNLFNESPKYRRNFFDSELAKLSKSYTKNLNSYLSVIKNRNILLKEKSIDNDLITVFNQQLSNLNMKIGQQRSKLVDKINNLINDKFYSLTRENIGKISIKYFTNIDINSLESNMNLYKNYLERDQLLKFTSIGVHKDDFKFYINNHKIEEYCSSGQCRLVLLATKLVFVDIIKEIIKDVPILLLDDILSELDDLKIKNLFDVLDSKQQVFITTTSINKNLINRNFQLIKVG
ncbi:MAG: DNA replication and repair protein RecF [Erysipelotrichaceae bacterium]